MLKKIGYIAIATFVLGLIYYLFVYPADYKISFQAKALPGTISQTLKAWNNEMGAQIIEQNPFDNVKQTLKFSDSTQVYDWHFTTLNDSTSKVDVYIKDENYSIINRLKKPFYDIPLKQQSAKTVNHFYDYLKEHLSEFKITFNGEEDLKSTYCAYVPLKGKQSDKARGMMQNYTMLANTMANNEVQLNGPPFVEITKWDIDKDSIYYNFCFPIIRSEKLPNHPEIKYKRLFATKALKATYNGNYITSDRAWYTLLKKAKDLNKDIELTPIEYFYNNPNVGGNAINWKAEIYMPIK